MLKTRIELRSNNLGQHKRRRNTSTRLAQMPCAYYPNLQVFVHQIDGCIELRRIVTFVYHKLRFQHITTSTIVPELCVVALRPPIARLIVKRTHLTSHIPEWHRIEIRRIRPQSLRIHSAHLINMISSHAIRSELLNECLLGTCLRKTGHFIVHPAGGLERHRSEVNCNVSHFFCYATRSFAFLAFDAQLTGLSGRVLDGTIPFVGQLMTAKTDD